MNFLLMKKICLWIIGLTFFMLCNHCAKKLAETELPPPAPVETAPSAQPAEPSFLPPVKAVPPGEVTYFVHTVRYPGETVSIIAIWYLGIEYKENWQPLEEANPDIKKDPNVIRGGDKIRIPKNLMTDEEIEINNRKFRKSTKEDPMPKEFVDSFYPKKHSKPVPPQPMEEEPKLFGPKKYPRK
jgi:hypothetical protein